MKVRVTLIKNKKYLLFVLKILCNLDRGLKSNLDRLLPISNVPIKVKGDRRSQDIEHTPLLIAKRWAERQTEGRPAPSHLSITVKINSKNM